MKKNPFENFPAVGPSREAAGEREVRTVGDLSRAVYSDFFRMHAEEIRKGENVTEKLKTAIDTALNQTRHMKGQELAEQLAKYLQRDLESVQLLDEKTKDEVGEYIEKVINPLEKAA